MLHELTKEVILNIFANGKILGESQTWLSSQPSTQSPLQKWFFSNHDQKLQKSRNESFFTCPILFYFLFYLFFLADIFFQDCSSGALKKFAKIYPESSWWNFSPQKLQANHFLCDCLKFFQSVACKTDLKYLIKQ